MGERSSIEWCDSTFNPWIGCTRVSPACDHCYAAASTPARTLGIAWGAGQPRRRTAPATWRLPLRWNAKPFYECTSCGWRGENPFLGMFCPRDGRGKGCGSDPIRRARRRVFCASLADVFDNEVPASWRADLFSLIRATPNLDWLLLTKRIGNVVRMMDEAGGWSGWGVERLRVSRYPLPNVWLGATICNQTEADRDIPRLCDTPASVRFLSMEPLLGRVDLCEHLGMWWNQTMGCFESTGPTFNPNGINWVIAGGESGPKARPVHPNWLRSLRDQCAAADVPFLFKQWGEWRPAVIEAGGDLGGDLRRGVVQHLHAAGNPEGHFRRGDAYVRRVGKKAAGRALDGAMHNGFPEVRCAR